MLTALSRQLTAHNSKLQAICVDNCCMVRAKFQRLFRAGVRVHLDILIFMQHKYLVKTASTILYVYE